MAQQQTSQTPSHFGSLVFNYVLFTFLGLACSFLWQSYYNTDNDNIGQHLHLFSTQTQEYALKEVRTILQGTDCEDVKEEAKCPDNLKTFMGTKLRYQFEPIVKNESSVGHCHVAKVYGLVRHGTRYPTSKHLAKWKVLQQNLPKKLALDYSEEGNGSSDDWSVTARELRQWANSLYQDVADGRAEATELTEGGIREQYCLGKRLRERFPGILKAAYSPLFYDFRSTEVSRAVKSGLAYAQGLFEETNPEVISMKSIEEKEDVFLRYDELPCPEYDQKVTYNKSLKDWLDSYFDTPPYKKVVENVQRHFDPAYWKLEGKDVHTFYKICVHEISILGTSRWCDLFEEEDLSVLSFHNDLQAYWIKGRGHSITWKRSVYLVQAILDFLTKGKQSIALSFAHAETIFPLLSFLKTFSVSSDLTPANYQELKSRKFVSSLMVPYSANIYLVLYDCSKETLSSAPRKPDLYVRLLVNEEPVEIGLCSGSDTADQWEQSQLLCRLELLRQSAYNVTDGFSTLTQLCKPTG